MVISLYIISIIICYFIGKKLISKNEYSPSFLYFCVALIPVINILAFLSFLYMECGDNIDNWVKEKIFKL